jgi:hypothetical protein
MDILKTPGVIKQSVVASDSATEAFSSGGLRVEVIDLTVVETSSDSFAAKAILDVLAASPRSTRSLKPNAGNVTFDEKFP